MSLGGCSRKGDYPGWQLLVRQADRLARENDLTDMHFAAVAAAAAVGVPARDVAGGQRSKVASDAVVAKVCDLVAGGG